MSSRIKIGVVGAARILPAHLRGLRLLREAGYDDFRITALCSRRVEDALMFRKRGEGPPPRPSVIRYAVDDPLNAPHMYVSDLHPDTIPEVYSDWREMLARADVDAVLNLTTLRLHHEVTLDALRAGKHVLTEKPFAVSIRAGQKMIEEAGGRGLMLGVAEPVRYSVETRQQRWAIESGAIGDVQMWISGGMGAADWSPDRIVAKTPWRHRKVEAGGGPAVDMAVHLFSIIRYLCGEVDEIGALAPRLEPRRRTYDEGGRVVEEVENDTEDAFFANLRFASGAVGTAFWGWGGHGEPTAMKDGPAVYGTRGCMKGGEVVLDGGERRPLAALFESASEEQRDRWFPRGLTDFFALELLDFLTSVQTGQPMETDGAEGMRDLAHAFAILESARANHPVKVGDVLAGRVRAYQAEIDQAIGL